MNKVMVFKEKEGCRRERSASVNLVLDKWLKRKKEEVEEGMEDSEEEGERLRYSKKGQGAIKKKEGLERKEEDREEGEDEMEVDINMRVELEKLKKELQ